MTITLFENFRAVFYAPFYVAHALEAYRDEGVDVRLKTSNSPGPTAGGLAAGEAGVWWGGPMRILVAHDREPDCGLVGFCEVVTRDPFFVLGRAPRPDFRMSDLVGLRIGTVSEVWAAGRHTICLIRRPPAGRHSSFALHGWVACPYLLALLTRWRLTWRKCSPAHGSIR